MVQLAGAQGDGYGTRDDGRGGHPVRDLREAERTAAWFDDPEEFHEVVRRAFAQQDRAPLPGWEPLARTRRRVVAAAHALLEGSTGDLVLVGHGTAWTLLVAELTGAEPDLEAWRQLRMPDVAVLQVAADHGAAILKHWGA